MHKRENENGCISDVVLVLRYESVTDRETNYAWVLENIKLKWILESRVRAKAALCNFGRMWRGERGMENWVMHVGLSEKRRTFPLLSVTVPNVRFSVTVIRSSLSSLSL